MDGTQTVWYFVALWCLSGTVTERLETFSTLQLQIKTPPTSNSHGGRVRIIHFKCIEKKVKHEF